MNWNFQSVSSEGVGEESGLAAISEADGRRPGCVGGLAKLVRVVPEQMKPRRPGEGSELMAALRHRYPLDGAVGVGWER